MARFPALEPNDEIGVCEIRMIARFLRARNGPGGLHTGVTGRILARGAGGIHEA